ncbi:MAG: GGDEF domain-containing protein [Nitrospiraceae bacterium]|nr:MAG: GGDEF domain-containing protein [Nitrospiraceae bacterium]
MQPCVGLKKEYYEAQSAIERHNMLELLDSNSLTTYFQTIFSSRDGAVYGYEALTRIKEDKGTANIGDLFKTAIMTDTISSLDVRCRENAIRLASSLGINQDGAYLFLNICPETLMDPAHRDGIIDELVEEAGLSKDRIIIEITEESAVKNHSLFNKAIERYRDKGYKIAIDDFGSGYGGLKMLSIIEPDFVKIDRYFISNIDKALVKFNLVDCITTACHRIGINVIAEGIEREEELKVVLGMGIGFLQGYYMGKPSPALNRDNAVIPISYGKKTPSYITDGEQRFIGDIANKVEPIPPSADIMVALNRFIRDPELRGLPVVEGDRVMGVLCRNRFLENQILRKYGYGIALNAYRKIVHLMEQPSPMVEANTIMEDAAQRIQLRKFEFLYDDICVTKNGKYYGTVAVNVLLDAITERNLTLARGANPLTGLPGNESIQREINKRLSKNIHFDVCYIDLDNFKPYNDHYGFEKGDCVIKNFAAVIQNAISDMAYNSGFAGHIGGDDFILIAGPQASISICEKIISNFKTNLIEFHGVEDYKRGFYSAKNRRGEEERFELLSISIGIASTAAHKIESYAHLASIATEIKKLAKMQKGSSIVRDRRIME